MGHHLQDKKPDDSDNTKLSANYSFGEKNIFKTIYEQAPYGILISDQQYNIVDVNAKACQILGYSRQTLESLTASRIIHPDDLANMPIISPDDILMHNYPDTWERRYKKADGSYIQVSVALRAIEHSSFFAIFFHDISSDKKMLNALLENEAKYRTLFEKAKDAIFLLGADSENVGKIIDANNSAAHMHGYTVSELVGKHITELDSPEDAEKAGFRIKKMLDGHWIQAELNHVHKDGSRFPVEVSAGMIQFGGKRYILAIDRDISEHKKNQEILKNQLTFLQTLIDTIPNPVFYKDAAGKYIGSNKAFENFIGVSNSQLQGKSVHDIAPGHLADQYTRADKELLETKTTQEYEAKVKFADNALHDVIFYKAVFYGPDGQVAGLVGVMLDITDRKKYEKEKLQLEEKLYQAQKMEAIANLSAGIAHDFNNILSGILGASQLAKLHADSPETIHQHIENIIKGCWRAADLVNQILTFSRQKRHEKQPLKLHLLLKEVIKLFKSTLPATIEIHEKIASKAMIMADPGQIHQVIMNLCTNAYHAMKKTGGILTVSTREITISSAVREPGLHLVPGQYMQLEVEDTGHGISPENLNKIFDPYFTTKTHDTGTGLGLSVVHGILKDHNGHIKVKSRPGKGTSFQIFFPATQSVSKQNADQNKTPFLSRGNETILLVEDEQEILLASKEMLKDYGYAVHAFMSAVEALHEFQKNPAIFDVVVTDMNMPKMTGRELVDHLLKIRPDIPVILCSGYGENDPLIRTQRKDIHRFLQKPFDLDQLILAVRDVLEKK